MQQFNPSLACLSEQDLARVAGGSQLPQGQLNYLDSQHPLRAMGIGGLSQVAQTSLDMPVYDYLAFVTM